MSIASVPGGSPSSLGIHSSVAIGIVHLCLVSSSERRNVKCGEHGFALRASNKRPVGNRGVRFEEWTRDSGFVKCVWTGGSALGLRLQAPYSRV
jgi:hypothetical protein